MWFALVVFIMLLGAAVSFAVTEEPLYLFDWLMLMLLLFALATIWW